MFLSSLLTANRRLINVGMGVPAIFDESDPLVSAHQLDSFDSLTFCSKTKTMIIIPILHVALRCILQNLYFLIHM